MTNFFLQMLNVYSVSAAFCKKTRTQTNMFLAVYNLNLTFDILPFSPAPQPFQSQHTITHLTFPPHLSPHPVHIFVLYQFCNPKNFVFPRGRGVGIKLGNQ